MRGKGDRDRSEFLIRKKRPTRIIKRLETEFSSAGCITYRGISSNISGRGIFVRTSRPFAPDAPVDLTIRLPDHSLAKLKGKVRWATRGGRQSEKNGMGIEIIERDQNFVDFVNTLLQPGEQMQYEENKNAESEPPACEKNKQGEEDAEIDTIVDSLFPKRRRK